MKILHRPDLYCWSDMNEEKNIDFNGYLWVHPEGNIIIDPMPLSPHNQERLTQLGGAEYVIITNSDHIRAAQETCRLTGATLCAPVAEQSIFRTALPELAENAIWLGDGDEPMSGLRVLVLHGSKTSGELALLLNHDTLICGDLVRAHKANDLMLLPDMKLTNKQLAIASLSRLSALKNVQHVLVGDGWPLFDRGHEALNSLLKRVSV